MLRLDVSLMLYVVPLLILLLLFFICYFYLLQLRKAVAHVRPYTVIFACAQQKRIDLNEVQILDASVEDGQRSANKLELLKT